MQKYFAFTAVDRRPKSMVIPHRLVPHEGRIAIVTDAGRDAVDARASGAQWQSQGEMNLVSGQLACETIGALADGKAVWFWHPLLVLSWRRRNQARPGLMSLNPPATVTRRIRRRGEHEISRKTIARGMPGLLRCTCGDYTRVLHYPSHTRPRVHWAPGIPCALCFPGRTVFAKPRAHRAAVMRSRI